MGHLCLQQKQVLTDRNQKCEQECIKVSHYAFAIFTQAAPPLELERSDTRLYFHRKNVTHPNQGTCIGSIWLQNPGSARYANPHQPLGTFAALQTDPLMRHLRNLLDAVLKEVLIPEDSYIELLNTHYFSDVKDGPKGATALQHVPVTEICKKGISPTSRFLLLSLGGGWASRYSELIRNQIAQAKQPLTVIAPKGPQTKPNELRVTVINCTVSTFATQLPDSTFANPVGASASWKERYVQDVSQAIITALKQKTHNP